jgi:excisionase family DNA binding protein
MTQKGVVTRRYTFDEAAAYLGVSKSYLYKQSSLGRIVFYWLGNKKVTDESDLIKFLGDQRARAQHKRDQTPIPNAPVAVGSSYESLPIDDEISALVYGKR